MTKRFVKYFLSGLGLILPFVGLAFLLLFLFNKIRMYWDTESVLVLVGPIIIGLIAIGYTSTYFGIRMFSIVEKQLLQTPLIGSLYKAIKEVTSAFVGAENKFSEPVLVLFAGDVYKLGFITNKENQYLKSGDTSDDDTLYSVYFPLSFSLSGDLYFVPRKRIHTVDTSAKEAMQMIVSGGLIKGTVD